GLVLGVAVPAVLVEEVDQELILPDVGSEERRVDAVAAVREVGTGLPLFGSRDESLRHRRPGEEQLVIEGREPFLVEQGQPRLFLDRLAPFDRERISNRLILPEGGAREEDQRERAEHVADLHMTPLVARTLDARPGRGNRRNA